MAAAGAAAAEAAPTVQIIDGDGGFHEDALKAFVAANGIAESRANYQVVAIMGPQSSGKSTLMNHVVRLAARRGGGVEGGGRGKGGGGAAKRTAAAEEEQRDAP